MKYSSSNRGIPVGNPIANIFVVLVGALVIGVSVVLGFVAFIVLGSIVAVLAAVIGLRLWWFKRRLHGQAQGSPTRNQSAPGGVIEGEYHVVKDKRDGARDSQQDM